MVDVAGVILAGGKSTRMGEDKANLKLNGMTLLGHMIALVHEAGIEDCYVSRGDYIPDDVPTCGPLSGVHAMLKHNMDLHQYLIFLPVDMPKLTPNLIEALVIAPSEKALVYFTSHKMPFRLKVEKKWLQLIEFLLENTQDFSLGNFQKYIEEYCVLDVKEQEQHCFDNINTPEEWRSFIEER